MCNVPPKFYQLCRLCLSIDKDGALSIFDDVAVNRNIPSKIMTCLSILVANSDPLPHVICIKCTEQLEALYKFKEVARKAEDLLNQFLTYTKQLTGTPETRKMSQKTPRRSRRPTNDDEFKQPQTKSNGAETIPEETPPAEETTPEKAKAESNGTETSQTNETESERITRSRSNTPQSKKEEKQPNVTNGQELTEEEKQAEPKETEQNNDREMEALVVNDETEPELVFEENSDRDSEKSSPVLTRCATRRSQTGGNIPTPNTLKIDEDEEIPLTQLTPKVVVNGEDLNDSFESENASTKAQAGGDSTRLDVSSLETNSFLIATKNKSFPEALRRLSSRKTIRPLNDKYRRRVLNSASRRSVESVGLKRKGSESEDCADDSKRFRSDSPGFFSRFTSPLHNIRSSFRVNLPCSTPKLTGYKDGKVLIEEKNSAICDVNEADKRWCSVM